MQPNLKCSFFGTAIPFFALCFAGFMTGCKGGVWSGSKGIDPPGQAGNSNSSSESAQRKEQLKAGITAEIEALKKLEESCTFGKVGNVLDLKTENALQRLFKRGSQMAVVGADGKKVMSFESHSGAGLLDKSNYTVVSLVGTGSDGKPVPLSFARFKKGNLSSCGEEQEPPVVELFSCKANPEELKSSEEPSAPSMGHLRVNRINGARSVQIRVPIKAIGAALANTCPKSSNLRYKYGPNCNELPLGKILNVPDPSLLKLPSLAPGLPTYAMVLGKRSGVGSVFQIAKNGKSARALTYDKGDFNESLAGLWFPYFMIFEKLAEQSEAGAKESANLAAEILGNFVPGGALAAKVFELSVGAAVDLAIDGQGNEED